MDTLLEFKAGKMQYVDKTLKADSRRGLIRLMQAGGRKREHHLASFARITSRLAQ
jgi:hypothetical protein